MANGLICDRCGKNLLIDEEVRYLVRIEVMCAYDPLEITADDLAADRTEEIRGLLGAMSGLTEQQVLDSVYRKYEFDLCPPCQADYLKRPLPGRDEGRFT